MRSPIVSNPGRFPLSPASLFAYKPAAEEIIKNVLIKQGQAMLFGYSGDGKSFIALSMCGAIARGDSHWFGHRITESVPITWLCLEGSMAKRIRAYETVHGELPDSFRIFEGSIDLRNTQDLADFIASCLSAGQTDGIVVIDTLAQSASGFEENSGKDMSEVLAAGKAIQEALGGVCLYVHHCGKDRTRGSRGHSSLPFAMDSIIEVRRTELGRSWHVRKQKDLDDNLSANFHLKVVDLYEDEFGDQVTSCVVEPDEAPKPIATAKDIKALAILKTMCRTVPKPMLSDWRNACVEAGLLSGTTATIKKSMDRIKESLFEQRLIIAGMTRGVWIPFGGIDSTEDDGDE